jgi:hypothetical protein
VRNADATNNTFGYSDSNSQSHSHRYGDPDAETYSNLTTSSDASASPDTARLRPWLDKYQSPEITETYIKG